MESKANNVPWESFLRKATDAFHIVKFDNTQHSVAAVKAEAKMTHLADKAELAQTQLDAAELMLQGMQDRRDVLAKELSVAEKNLKTLSARVSARRSYLTTSNNTFGAF